MTSQNIPSHVPRLQIGSCCALLHPCFYMKIILLLALALACLAHTAFASQSDPNQQLLLAAQNGDFEAVKTLLASGADKDAKDVYGWTPLHIAAFEGHLRVVQELLNRGTDKDARGMNRWTPLHCAASKGYLGVVQELLKRGADKDARTKRGWTPLHEAACFGKLEVVRMLLDAGADRSAITSTGSTPLDVATLNGHPEVVQELSASLAPFTQSIKQHQPLLCIGILIVTIAVAELCSS
jgi:ankyrin repeat protein